MIQDKIIQYLKNRIEYLDKEVKRLISISQGTKEEVNNILELQTTRNTLQGVLIDFYNHLNGVNQ